jgi:hypothetical protein
MGTADLYRLNEFGQDLNFRHEMVEFKRNAARLNGLGVRPEWRDWPIAVLIDGPGQDQGAGATGTQPGADGVREALHKAQHRAEGPAIGHHDLSRATIFYSRGIDVSHFSFKNVGHFFATVAGDIVKGAKAVANVMLQAQKVEPEIEALTSLVFLQAVELERGAFALLGMAAQAVSETGDATAANGINITLDPQLVADMKALIQAI